MLDKKEVWLPALKIVVNALEENDCSYFLDTGTLLGAIRDNQFIPWDNDIDIGIVDCNDLEIVIPKICDIIYKNGYNVTATLHEIDVFDSTGILDLGIKFYELKDDCYVASFGKITGSKLAHSLYISLSKNIILKKGYGKYVYKSILSSILRAISPLCPNRILNFLNARSKMISKNLSIPRTMLEGFEDRTFYDSKCKVPKNYKEYLAHRYGTNWEKPNRQYNYITDDKSIK